MQEISGIINANKRAFIIQVLGSLKSVFWDKSRSWGYHRCHRFATECRFFGDGRREGITSPAMAKHTAAMQRCEAGLEK